MGYYLLRSSVPSEILDPFLQEINSIEWNYGVPGGFLTNIPQRHVNTLGDGSGIKNDGTLVPNDGWNYCSWTSKINQNNVTLYNQPESLPSTFCRIVPYFRQMLLNICPSASVTENTFNLAVCNYYSDPNMTIKAHTDANQWYPREMNGGPVFTSLTLYPQKQPQDKDEYARFQIKKDGKWESIYMGHESILVMDSRIEHRVQPHLKSKASKFCPRINITFRSTYPKQTNPLLNLMAISNYSRYYRNPIQLSFPSDLDPVKVKKITYVYNNYLSSKGKSPIAIQIQYTSEEKKELKKHYRQQYLSLLKSSHIPQIKANVTLENIFYAISFLNS